MLLLPQNQLDLDKQTNKITVGALRYIHQTSIKPITVIQTKCSYQSQRES